MADAPASNSGGLGGLGGYELQNQIPLLYQSLLGRSPDQEGAQYYLNSGLSLDDIANNLANSQEGQNYWNKLNNPEDEKLSPVEIWKQPFDFDPNANVLDTGLNYLKQYFGDYGAVGALASLGRESHLNPTQQQWNIKQDRPYQDTTEGNQGLPLGFGLAQWGQGLDGTSGRLSGPDKRGNLGLLDFAQSMNLDANSPEAQYRYMVYEAANKPEFKGLINQLKNSNSYFDATNLFERRYEGAGVKAMAERQRNADMIQQYMNGGFDSLSPEWKNTLSSWIPSLKQQGPPAPTPSQYQMPNLNFTPDSFNMNDPTSIDNQRLQAAGSGIDNSVAANNVFTNGWLTDASQNLLNFNANSVFNGGGMITNPVFGSSGTLGQPNAFGGNGFNNMPPMLTIQGPGSSSSDGP